MAAMLSVYGAWSDMTSTGVKEGMKTREKESKQAGKKERKKLMTVRQTQTESEKGSEKREIGAIIQLAAGAEGILSCHRSQPCRRGSKLFYCTLASVCVCAAPSYCLVAAYFV